MSDSRGLAVRLAVAAHMQKLIKQYDKQTRAAMAADMDPGDRKTAATDDGTKVGTVTYTAGRTVARVTDERALLAWAKENSPHNVVEMVAPAFRDHLLDIASKTGAPVDPHTGEVVPGIEVRQGEPYISVRSDLSGLSRGQLLDLVRANSLLALGAGDDTASTEDGGAE